MKKVDVIINPRFGKPFEHEYLVMVNGREVASHSVKDTAEQHKIKILTPIKPPMYKGKQLLIIIAVISFLFASCASTGPAMKRDCRGTWHTKQKGGFYL